MNNQWTEDKVETQIGFIPKVKTRLELTDNLNSFKRRWGFGRTGYIVKPGLYALGNPDADSEVFVSANYKMSFDRLRSNLNGIDGWILVLDTKGVNVWCSAGKGTFGTNELVNRVRLTGLENVVNHKRLILPQLAAPGVSAHEVKKEIGFRVRYGPIKAEDISEFLEAGRKASPEMRIVKFTLWDRMVVIPIEFVMSLKYAILTLACFVILSGLHSGGYSLQLINEVGFKSVFIFSGAYICGTVLGPLLLPFLPGKAFSVKGAWIGAIFVFALWGYQYSTAGWFDLKVDDLAWILIVPSVSSFLTMNFTGASTYTSLSGVLKEMRVAVPAQLIAFTLGIILWIVGRFI
ncbi:MAG: acetyl-CoA synthase subunit gamma [candidate division Zixibacteria bacterium]|nr:acetyl-CoA synthase subunit gamma [candidate division Zixibacteria bacterium]